MPSGALHSELTKLLIYADVIDRSRDRWITSLGGISQDNPLAGSFETLIMLVQGPTLRDAACIWITKYDGYTPPERFITHNNPLVGSFETLIMIVQGPTLHDAACIYG